jgi:Lon protease-like protein
LFKVADNGELLAAVESLPLFPLPGAVFIPHTLLPLHVFEPRYRDLVDDAMKRSGYLAIPRLKPGWERAYDGNPEIFPIAGFGKIVRYDPMPDGRANIVILGLGRTRIRTEMQSDTLYRVAEGSLLEDVIPAHGMAAVDAAASRLRVMLAQILGGRPGLNERLQPLLNKETAAIPMINGLAHLLLPDVDARQQFIEMDNVSERIEHVETMLAGALVESAAQA